MKVDGPRRRNQELERIDIDALLKAGAANPRDYGAFLYDELPYKQNIPLSWEAAIIRATELNDIKDPYGFLFFCAEMLIKLDSDWPSMPSLLARLLEMHTGIVTLELVHKHYLQNRRSVPLDLAERIVHAFERLPSWKRWVSWTDGNVREVVTACRKIVG